ncbi:MAG: hypothetical protein KDD50_03435 [Bdellovibrionales bacterium]|nr:hypothetical protein [Bdellovibrionales bacterium]
MATTNWDKIRTEISKIKDLDSLKAELNKLSKEIKSFDINTHLSPSANRKLKSLEDQYHKVVKAILSIQKQIDSEVNKTLGQIKKSRLDVEKKIKLFKNSAEGQRKKIKKMSQDLKKKVTKKAAKKTTKKKAVKKATKKTTKKTAVKKVAKKTTKKKTSR